MLLLGAGALLLIVGLLFLSVLWMSPADPDNARSGAREGAQSLAASIDRIYHLLGHDEVLEQARLVPPDQPHQTAALADALQAVGIETLIDLRVYQPHAEELEVGAYPEADFTTIQMLIEARRRETARARLHQLGTANEHFAFARAVPGPGDEVAAIMLVRLEADLATRTLAAPPGAAWVRLVQGSRLIASYPPGIEAEATGRELVEGSTLAVEWGVPPAIGILSLTHSTLVSLLGLVLVAVGGFLRFCPVARPARRPRPPQATSAPPPSRPLGAAEATPPRTARKPAPPPAPPPSEPKPDLPDWLLDEESGKGKPLSGEAGATEQARGVEDGKAQQETLGKKTDEAAAPPGDGALELDVPDLDDILRQIEEEGESAAASEPAAGGQADSESESVASTTDEVDDSSVEIGDGLDLLIEEEPESAARQQAASTVDRGPTSDFELELAVDREPESDEPRAEDVAKSEAVAAEKAPDGDLKLATDDLPSEPEAASDRPATSGVEAEPEAEPESEPSQATLEAIDGSELFSIEQFDEDSIRGVFGRTMNAELATLIGRALGTMAVQRGFRKIAVARDGRTSGPLLLSALIRGLRNAGLDVIEAGAVPIPALWYAACEMADGCGVMVTASHAPPEHNGFKVMLGGRILGRARLMEAARIAIDEEFAEGEGSYTQEEVARQYATALAERIELKRPIKVVVDCGNGIAGAVVPILFEALGADLIPLYCDVDGGFPNHLPNPTDPECLEDLRLCVRNFQAELGFAFDGDADRMVLVANDSEVAGTDQVLMLLARTLLADAPEGGDVVMDVRCSAQVRQVVEQAGGQLLISAAGGVPMSHRVIEAGAMLGGEMGGQIVIARHWYPFADAIYAAARLAELFAAGKQSVQESLAELPQSKTTGELVLTLADERAQRLLEQLRTTTDFGDGDVTAVDGLRVDFSDRWGLIRIRPGQGEIELRFSGDDPSALAQIKGEFREWLLAVDPDLRLPY